MRRLIVATAAASILIAAAGCGLVERPPPSWPEPEPGTPPAYVELMRRCRAVAVQRGARANHATRAQAVLAWAGGASLASGAVTATLAGVEPRQREGIIGAAVVTTITAGVTLGSRFVAPADEQRERYEATRAHERAADQGLWLLARTTARIAAHRDAAGRGATLTTGSTHAEPTLRELVRHRAELQGYVMTELSQCVAVDPRREPAPLPRLHTLAPSKRTLPFEG